VGSPPRDDVSRASSQRWPEAGRAGDGLELLPARPVADVPHVHRSRVLAMMAGGTLPSLRTSDQPRWIPRGDSTAAPEERAVTRSLRYGRDTQEWWTLEFAGEDGERYAAESQYLDSCPRRPAELAMRPRARRGGHG
jgi:hypothetical protein